MFLFLFFDFQNLFYQGLELFFHAPILISGAVVPKHCIIEISIGDKNHSINILYYLCLSVSLNVGLPANLYACLLACLTTSMPASCLPPACLPACLPACPPAHPPACLTSFTKSPCLDNVVIWRHKTTVLC